MTISTGDFNSSYTNFHGSKIPSISPSFILLALTAIFLTYVGLNHKPYVDLNSIFTIKETSQIDVEESKSLIKIINIWKENAISKIVSKKTDDSQNDKSTQIFMDSKNTCKNIINVLSSTHPSYSHCKILTCYDKYGILQSIAITETIDNEFSLISLATNPHNIEQGSIRNLTLKKKEATVQNYPQVKGASSHLMNYIFTQCIEKKYSGIKLSSLISSIPFYAKFGFNFGDKKQKFCEAYISLNEIRFIKIQQSIFKALSKIFE